MTNRSQVAAASAAIDRLDERIAATEAELHDVTHRVETLRARMSSTDASAPSGEEVVTAEIAEALLQDPAVEINGTGILGKLLRGRRKRQEEVEAHHALVGPIKAAIASGEGLKASLGEHIEALRKERREKYRAFTEAASETLLSELEATLDRASQLAGVLYGLADDPHAGRLGWTLARGAKVVLERRGPSISGKLPERVLFPKNMSRRPGRDEVKIINGAQAIEQFRAELRNEPKIRRAA